MGRDRPGSFARRLLARVSIATLSLAGALALAEGALRLRGALEPDPPLYLGDRQPGPIAAELGVLDPELGWKLAPHQTIEARHPDHAGVVYRANGQGFRSSVEFEPDLAPPQGVTRIAFVGDSFTFGMGVGAEATFAELVAASIPGGQALNLGQAGFGVDQMERALSVHGLPLRPALVVVSFVDDDLARSASAYRFRGDWIPKPTCVLEGGRLRPMVERDRPPALNRWLEQETRLAEAWRRLGRRLGRRFGTGACWRLNRALFERMRAECVAAGVPLVVVRIPQAGAWRPAPGYRRDLEALGIPVLDLGEEAPADPRALYFQHDVHLNPAGHRFVAERLCEFLARRRLP